MKIYKLSPTQGTIPPEKIVGRTKDLQRLEKTLYAQSVLIEEVRRMGKTLFVKKYAYLQHENQKVIYFTLQGVKDINELIDILMQSLRSEQRFGKLNIAWNSIRRLYNNLKPEEVDLNIVSFKLPEWKTKWKEALNACLKDIATRERDDEETLVLILDELPIMIWDWIQNNKAEQAKEFLDVLRKNRQLLEETGRVRFIICGSIGMQVVLKKLKEDYSYTGEAFNDVDSFSIGAMLPEEATFLCNCLFLDDFEIKKGEDKEELIQLIVDYSECLPFYINILFTIIRNECENILSKENIDQAFSLLINEPQYSKVLKQLEERIKIYYSKGEGEIMMEILDLLSLSKSIINEKEIIEKLGLNKKNVKASLYTLHSENYLKKEFKEDSSFYTFKYKLVKKWWKINMA